MAWPAEEPAEVVQLKRALQRTADQLADQQNAVALLKEENTELKQDVRDGVYRAQQEAQKAVDAIEALRKKTDVRLLAALSSDDRLKLTRLLRSRQAYTNLLMQKDNAETALSSAEAKIKEQEGQIKRLTYEVEVTSARSADSANSRVAEDKAALEKRVHQLTTQLQKAQMDLEKEKDRFGFQPAIPAASSKARSSSVAGDTLPTSIRPPSSLSHHSSIPTVTTSKLPAPAGRRGSVTVSNASNAAIKTSSAQQSQTISQLESSLSAAQETITALSQDLSSAASTISTLEASLSSAQFKLEAKSSDLLRVENLLMALERSSKEEVDELKSQLEDVRYELEGAKEEAREVRDELSRELDVLVKAAREEKQSHEGMLDRIRSTLERKEADLEAMEGNREELERLLEEARAETTATKAEADAKGHECEELENELAWLEEEHMTALEAAETEKQALEEEIEDLKKLRMTLEKRDTDLEGMEGNREELERLLEEAREAAAQARSNLQDKEGELEELENELAWLEEQHEVATHEAVEERRAREIRIEDLERDLEGAHTATPNYKSAHDALRSDSATSASSAQTLFAQIAILEAEVSKKDAELDTLTSRLSILGELSAAHGELAAAHEQLAAELESLRAAVDEKDATLADLATKLDEATQAHVAAAGVGAQHETNAQRLQQTVDSLTSARDELASTVQIQEDALAALRSTLDRRETFQTPSFEDAEVRLASAEQEVASLRKQLKEASAGDWGAGDSQKVSNDRITALEGQVAELEAALEAEQGLVIGAQRETTAAQEALAEAQNQLVAVEGQLSVEIRAREAAGQAKQELEEKVEDLELSTARLQDLEDALLEASSELDDLRASSEDASLAALQEITDLQARLREQEGVVDQLERQIVSLDALRRVLGDTEAKADSLGWELRDTQSAAQKQEQAAEEKVKALIARAEAAEEDVHRLRSELDQTRHRLSDAQDSLDQAQVDLATQLGTVAASPRESTPAPVSLAPSTPSPATPTSRSFGFSPPSASDPAILILRLREERDELRQRLDFARTEAQFRLEALQDRLREAEETKAREISVMEIDLMDKHAAWETECETNEKVEEALRQAMLEKVRLEEELETATRALKARSNQVADAERRLKEAEKAREEQEADRENIRVQLDSANDANEELTSALSSLRTELGQAAEEIDRQHAAAAAGTVRIVELEAALATARQQGQSNFEQNNALADFAALCETLQSDVLLLQDKISRQSDLIAQRERSIALLQLNLAVRVAIEDDEDVEDSDGDCSVLDGDSTDTIDLEDATIAVEPELSPAGLADLQLRLADELSIREGLEEQLSSVRVQLGEAIRQASAASVSSRALEEELAAVKLDAQEQVDRLEQANASLRDAQARHDALQAGHDALSTSTQALRQTLDELETLHVDRGRSIENLQAVVETKTAELAIATERIAGLECSLEQARSASDDSNSSAQERVADLERQLFDIEARLVEASQQRDASGERAASAESSLAAAEERVAALSKAYDDLEQRFNGRQDDLESLQSRLAEVEAEKERLAAVLEAEKANDGEGRSSLEAELQAKNAEVVELESARTDAQREISSLKQQLEFLSVDAEEKLIVHQQSQHRVALLEEQLSALQAELASVSQITDAVAALEAQLEEAVRVEQETSSKAQAAAEHSAKEIQTLRQLGRASQAEAEALSAEADGLRQQLADFDTRLQAVTSASQQDLQRLTDESRKNIEEVIDALQACENDKAAVEEQVRVLEAQIKQLEESFAAARSGQSNGEAEARVAELEKLLEAKMLDVEEADEKLIDALKLQKRSTAQIERLKAKIATLQRDLLASKTTPVPTPVPTPIPISAPAEAATPSNKKRRAPADFDPVSSVASTAPRAIVAKSVPAGLGPGRDKENAGETTRRPTTTTTTRRSTARAASPAKHDRPPPHVDTVVPLKPEHLPAASATQTQTKKLAREVLQRVDDNAVPAAPAAPAEKAAAASKMDALRARLAKQKASRALAPSSSSAA
ncbi:SPOSA6832_04351 [Sporobolomyces salmonicolor]|uniref:SPOSA6832_04351-mRNA-1:cds n=1 Tax=Sporidiobolus salmonicolor TaxID=5005 RepID=A0A0D6ER08_SPOSA|nr:SPOSA6832_04351 [Sporobolomyces salmonicolor]